MVSAGEGHAKGDKWRHRCARSAYTPAAPRKVIRAMWQQKANRELIPANKAKAKKMQDATGKGHLT